MPPESLTIRRHTCIRRSIQAFDSQPKNPTFNPSTQQSIQASDSQPKHPTVNPSIQQSTQASDSQSKHPTVNPSIRQSTQAPNSQPKTPKCQSKTPKCQSKNRLSTQDLESQSRASNPSPDIQFQSCCISLLEARPATASKSAL